MNNHSNQVIGAGSAARHQVKKPVLKHRRPQACLVPLSMPNAYVSGSQPLTLRVPLNCHQDLSRTTSQANGKILINAHAVAEQGVQAPPLHRIIMQEDYGQWETVERKRLPKLPVCSLSKHKSTKKSMFFIIIKKNLRECTNQQYFLNDVKTQYYIY